MAGLQGGSMTRFFGDEGNDLLEKSKENHRPFRQRWFVDSYVCIYIYTYTYIYTYRYTYIYIYVSSAERLQITQKNLWISSNSGSLATTPVTNSGYHEQSSFFNETCHEVTLEGRVFDRCHGHIQAGPKDLSPWWIWKNTSKNGCKCATFQLPFGDLDVQSSRFGWWVSLQDIRMEWGAMMGGAWIWLLWLHDQITFFTYFTQIPSLETHIISYI